MIDYCIRYDCCQIITAAAAYAIDRDDEITSDALRSLRAHTIATLRIHQ